MFESKKAIIRVYCRLTYFGGGFYGGRRADTVLPYLCRNIALLFLPRLTNYWGRKKAIYLTLAFGLAGCFLFGNVTGEWRMLAARFMQGLSCGLASSTVAGYYRQCAEYRPAAWRNGQRRV